MLEQDISQESHPQNVTESEVHTSSTKEQIDNDDQSWVNVQGSL